MTKDNNTTTESETSNVEDIDWNALDKLKRADLQRLCKEFSLPLKATSKNAEILEALRSFKKDYDEKKEQQLKEEQEKKKNDQQDIKNIVNNNSSSSSSNDTTTTTTTSTTTTNVNEEKEEEESKMDDKEDEDEEEEESKQPTIEVETQQQLLDTLLIPEINETDIAQPQQSKKRYEEELNNDDNDNDDDRRRVVQDDNLLDDDMEKKINHQGLKFRNYVPRDPTLLPYRIPKSKVPEIVEELMERLKVLETSGLDNSSLLPRKVNWDLKRDLEKKLNKLEKRTNVSVYQLIKQSILANTNGTNSNNNNNNNNNETSMQLLSRTVDKLK
ncbi:mRNA splicing factor [Cavenderia fasciculata]|uniref:mRNA splicing factor n=1 Tax=Cavenderia fasciculata TaxID=261658 RepID=F4PWP6_CACFS|nr:mRNA splicing factor [Cavenderia fasciculata]EGG20410.1 mRNA splicing factor [Cavenderia fasciculata]|eukprot:XP_004367393.1 mRNA splicing factor [Cavenderia fasciculata]